jgi:hypothetical protein
MVIIPAISYIAMVEQPEIERKVHRVTELLQLNAPPAA